MSNDNQPKPPGSPGSKPTTIEKPSGSYPGVSTIIDPVSETFINVFGGGRKKKDKTTSTSGSGSTGKIPTTEPPPKH